MLENAFFVKKWPKIEKKSRFFHFNHFCWQNWEYIQHNRSQNKREGYFLISSKFDPIFKICQGCKIFWIFFNFPFPWSKMVLHTNFQTYSTKIEVPTGQNVVWPTIMAQTLYLYIYAILQQLLQEQLKSDLSTTRLHLQTFFLQWQNVWDPANHIEFLIAIPS